MSSSPDDSGSADKVGGLPHSIGEAISKRRMVRSYLSDSLKAEVVDALVRAAHSGPSAGNTRSLALLVLAGPQVEAYWDVTLPATQRDRFPWPGLLKAPLLFIPYVDPQAYVQRYAEPDKRQTGLGGGPEAWTVPYWWVDGGAAAENVLLAATGLGLGACLFGQFAHEAAVRECFGVPDSKRAVGTIAVGYADEAQDRRSKSLARPRRSSTYYGRWGAKAIL